MQTRGMTIKKQYADTDNELTQLECTLYVYEPCANAFQTCSAVGWEGSLYIVCAHILIRNGHTLYVHEHTVPG